MSSAKRTFAATKEGLTKFLNPESPAYNNGVRRVLFPFSYSNQVLDISYEGNNFKERMVDISGTSPSSETNTSLRIISGPRLVTSLGPNFKAYIRSWRAATIDAGSPIEVYIAPQVVRVQEAEYANISADNDEEEEYWKISTSPPKSENYIAGGVATEYDTTYIFKTPLTFTIVEDSVTKYITFITGLDQE
jgi:hypothetical protein